MSLFERFKHLKEEILMLASDFEVPFSNTSEVQTKKVKGNLGFWIDQKHTRIR